MGGVHSATHNLGDALWIQEKQKQKYHWSGNRYDNKDHGIESHQHRHRQISMQDQRKLLKRLQNFAIISEDKSHMINSDKNVLKNFGHCFDTSSLQHNRPQLIPRAKLIDRNSLKDRLYKKQHHLSGLYDKFSEESVWPSRSHSVCDLHTLPPPLDSLSDPLPYTCMSKAWQLVSDPPGRFNILNCPKSLRQYHSVQDLNSVGDFIDIVEDNYYPGEENCSIECIYTQVKHKRKEHRSLDSILFEDDNDELEYFDIFNLLPLSNVRLGIDEPNVKSNHMVFRRNDKDYSNQMLKSQPTMFSVLTNKGNANNKIYSIYKDEISIAEIESSSRRKVNIDKKNSKIKEYFNIFTTPSETSVIDKSITSFHEIAKEKIQLKNASQTHDSKSNLFDINDNQQSNVIVDSCYFMKKHNNFSIKDNRLSLQNNEPANLYIKETQNNNQKSQIKEIDKTKFLYSLDIEKKEGIYRKPQVLKVNDNDVTKSKSFVKLTSLDLKSSHNNLTCTKKTYENFSINHQTFNGLNGSDLINNHVHEVKTMHKTNNNMQSMRLKLENARSFFEKKNINKDILINYHGKEKFVKTIKENSTILNKTYNTGKDSLGFDTKSKNLDLRPELSNDIQILSTDEHINIINKKINDEKKSNEHTDQNFDSNSKNQKNFTNLIRTQSCIDSIESQVSNEPEFDHVHYKIIKPNIFSKNIFNNSKTDFTYDGLMQYLCEYSFQDLLTDNNFIIIEPIRTEVERKSSFNETKNKSSRFNLAQNLIQNIKNVEMYKSNKESIREVKNNFLKSTKQSSLRKHFFYQPIRVNRELNDDELPDPDTVKNVRKMFEENIKRKLTVKTEMSRDFNTKSSISTKDLRTIGTNCYEIGSEKAVDLCRSIYSSRAKNLQKIFENLDKSITVSINERKDMDNIKNESKTRTIVQSFENKSEHTSLSNSTCSKAKRQLHNSDTESVSSAVSSDYQDTNVSNGLRCTASEYEELYCQDDDEIDKQNEGHYVSQDVLKKIREYGTSVTYYGGKVVNTYNRPLICPMVCKKSKISKKSSNYIKFCLLKSNSCDSRLELIGRLESNRNKYQLGRNQDKNNNLRQFTTKEIQNIEIISTEYKNREKINNKIELKKKNPEPPVVIGLEPKKKENRTFKADFKLGKLDDCTSINIFTKSSLKRWETNENIWRKTLDFGKIEFEKY